MDSSTELFLWAAGLGLATYLTCLALGWYQKRVREAGEMPAAELAEYREQLLEIVKSASTRANHQISLKRTWPSFGLTRAQQYAVIAPLLEHQTLHATDVDGRPLTGLAAFEQKFLLVPPPVVMLSERAWNEVIQPKKEPTFQFAENHGIIQVGNENDAKIANYPLNNVSGIIDALRSDGPHLHSDMREQAESWADSLEGDLANGRMKSVSRTLAAVASVVTGAAGIWTATAKFFVH